MATPAKSDSASRAQTVRRLAEGLGFVLLGVAPPQPSQYAGHVKAWLERGAHGEMGYLAEKLEERLDPRVLVPGARSIICVADLYAEKSRGKAGEAELKELSTSGRGSEHPRRGPEPKAPAGRIARYAWGDDYHRIMKKRLHALADALREMWPDHQFRSAVDTAPLLEREHAQRAGLGWVGKHTLVIHPKLGSWLLLGEIVTTLAIQSDAESGRPSIPDHCGTCTRCIDACPTQCITPYQIDAHRCISYLTLEHRGPIDPSLHPAMGDWIAGCDVCQEVCPFNQVQPATGPQNERGGLEVLPPYRSRPPAPAIPLLELLGWDADTRRDAFARSALKRLKLDQLKRNALIAAGNHLARHDNAPLRRRLAQIVADITESDLVRATAEAVEKRLESGDVSAGD